MTVYPGVSVMFYANIFDGVATSLLVGTGNSVELNPFIGVLFGWSIIIGMAIKMLFGLSLCYMYHKYILEHDSSVLKIASWFLGISLIIMPMGGILTWLF